MSGWVKGARLKKAITKEGGFAADSAGDLPFLLSEGMEVRFVPPQTDAPRSARVTLVEERAKGDFLVLFDTVDSRACAELLAGCFCLVHADDLDFCAMHSTGVGLEGWLVFDSAEGLVGQVLECLPSPAHPLLSIQREDGREVLVPFVEDFLLGFDEEEQRIDMQLPSGLLDL